MIYFEFCSDLKNQFVEGVKSKNYLETMLFIGGNAFPSAIALIIAPKLWIGILIAVLHWHL